MKKIIIGIAIPLSALLISVVLTLAMVFGIKKPTEPNRMSMLDLDGNEVNGICISDLNNSSNIVKYAYYTPNEFVSDLGKSVSTSTTEVDITKQKDIASKGTYSFIFYNINPNDEDFNEKKESLDSYLGSDKNWHFSLYLPPCFSAAYVYVNSELVAEVGSIKDYNYIEYSEKDGYSEIHKDATKPIIIDLNFYSRRAAMVNSFSQRAKIVTIHYESSGKRAGFTGVPRIGLQREIDDTLMNDRILLITISVAGAMLFSILIFACILKKSPFALPSAAMALGVAGFCLLRSFTYFTTRTPFLVTTCVPVFLGLIIVGAIISLIYAIKRRKMEFLIAPPIAFVMAVDYLVIAYDTPVFPNPISWLSLLILLCTTITAINFYASLEQRNVYLTNNLKSEVARQTEDLKTIIKERDKLLRYLSHDMKKPVSSIKNFIEEIRKNETNDENKKTLDIIDGKLDAMQGDFVELQKFAKMNFTAESSETVYTDEVINDLYNRLSPDCEANGITLKCFVPKIAVFAKSKLLCSVFDNLIFNAIEHSKCNNITIYAAKSSSVCKITIIDDGVGIESIREVFLPYYSTDSEGENLGLGLFISKQHMLSMGGNLTYARENNKSVFTVTLNLA